MLSQIKNSAFTKTLWGLMGLLLLNISVDSKDPYPNHIPKGLYINDQESIIEIILEKVLGFEDAIKDYDDHDTDDKNKRSNLKVDFTTHLFVDNALNTLNTGTARHKFPHYNAFLTNGFQKLNIPPPKI